MPIVQARRQQQQQQQRTPDVHTTSIPDSTHILLAAFTCFMLTATVALSAASAEEAPSTPFGFDHGTSTPVLVIKGLRDPQTDILAARVYDPEQQPKGDTDRPPLPKLYDLTPVILPNVDQESGEVRMLAVPEFHLNQTSQLRVAVWYPCYHRPEGVEMLMMPCFFEPMSHGEYAAGTAATSTHPGRRVVFHVRHHAPPRPVADNDTSVSDDGQAGPDAFAAVRDGDDDDVSPTTKVTCWLPQDDALMKKAIAIKVEDSSHWAQMRTLHYSARRERMFSKHEDPLPAVWYDYTVVPHGEVDVPKKDVLIRGRKYCRSWLWVTVPQTHIHKWVVHHDISKGFESDFRHREEGSSTVSFGVAHEDGSGTVPFGAYHEKEEKK